MQGVELFVYGLIALGWVVFQVIRRVLRAPRPLGTLAEEPAHSAPAPPPARDGLGDLHWGRGPGPGAGGAGATGGPAPVRWSVDAAQSAAEAARPQPRAGFPRTEGARATRHPHRPRLRSQQDLHRAVVLSAVIGPCRAVEPWQPPQEPR